ncbi:hypothetical protein D1007_60515 [Hordeum vulgare]|nr:hypothetical protein D1007_60515 [Hordeum vulgare]
MYAADLISTNLIRLIDGVLWLRMEALRIVLLDADGWTVDARFFREGERIDIGEIVSFPRVRDRIPVTGVGRDGGDGPDGTRVPMGGDAVGLQQKDDAGELRSGAETVRANTMRLMKFSEAARQGITGE